MELSTSPSKFEPGVYQGTPENLKEKKTGTPPLVRTMKSDVAEAIRNQNETTVSIAIAEQKKRAQEQATANTTAIQTETGTTTPAPKRIGRFVVIIIVFLFIALLGVGYVFLLPKLSAIKLPDITLPTFTKTVEKPVATSTEQTTPTLANSLIPAQSEKRFNISKQTRAQISQEIHAELTMESVPGDIKNLFFTEENKGVLAEISASKFMEFSEVTAPEILVRSLENAFMIGLISEGTSTSTPFIVLKVSEHQLGLAGMLEGEAILPKFFDKIFGTNLSDATAVKTKFHDIVIFGKDARIINIGTGKEIAYVFADENTIILAGSKAALEALIPLAPTPTSR